MRQGSVIASLLVVVLLGVAATASASNDPLYGQQWGMAMIGADAAHQTTEGQGATVAVVDTGANFAHPDLAGRLIPGHDFVDGDDDPTDQNDQDSMGNPDDVYHGTHVTGILAADADNGVGVEGVAPLASVLVVRVLGRDGSGSVDAVANGIDYARTHGANVINLSLGADVPLIGDSDTTIRDAIQRALSQGIVVVAAAGNNSMPICDQPRVQGPFMCVAAVDRNGSATFYTNFSGFGSAFGIAAPGGAGQGPIEDDILSTNKGAGYRYEAGTSQATPHVSGVAALLYSVGLRGQAIVDRIEQTARDAGPPGPDPIYGAGIVDARAAVAGFPPVGAGGAPPGGALAGRSAGSAARVSVARFQRIRNVLRYGLLVSCRAAGSGRCVALASARRRRIAGGSRRLTVGRTVTVRARTTRVGRAMLLAALRARRSVATSVRVTVPGAPVQIRRVTLRP
jgi:subtilisin family serine protease